MKKTKVNMHKMSAEELQAMLQAMSGSGCHKKSKGKGSYTRKQKHKKECGKE